MILILSEEGDYSTTKVMEWLTFNQKKVIRLNVEDPINVYATDGEVFVKTKNLTFCLKDITSYWYRRGAFVFSAKLKGEPSEFNNWCQKVLNDDSSVLCNYLDFMLQQKKHINEYFNSDLNKLIVLEQAKEVGLKVPKTYIINSMSHLKEVLINSSNGLITKNITFRPFPDDKLYIDVFTHEINLQKIESHTAIEIFPSLVQDKIDKKFEIRVFFLENTFHSMAIFSQLDEQTKIDFRNYNYDKPIRTTRFELPISVKIKINKLMAKLKLNCGSIDLILDTNNEFIFLEINPIGQFGMISSPCNYYLEKIVAKTLIN